MHVLGSKPDGTLGWYLCRWFASCKFCMLCSGVALAAILLGGEGSCRGDKSGRAAPYRGYPAWGPVLIERLASGAYHVTVGVASVELGLSLIFPRARAVNA